MGFRLWRSKKKVVSQPDTQSVDSNESAIAVQSLDSTDEQPVVETTSTKSVKRTKASSK